MITAPADVDLEAEVRRLLAIAETQVETPGITVIPRMVRKYLTRCVEDIDSYFGDVGRPQEASA